MKKPAPSQEEFAQLVRLVNSDNEWDDSGPDWLCDKACRVPVSLGKNMLDFLYTGHPDLAWLLLQERWPKKRSGRNEFARSLCQQMKVSHYWHDLHQWIGPCPKLGNPGPSAH
jgi:hypothetical protein